MLACLAWVRLSSLSRTLTFRRTRICRKALPSWAGRRSLIVGGRLKMSRIYPRPIFVTGERQPLPVFFTSSTAKFMQAQAVFDRVGLRLSYRADDADPYSESYEGSKEELLAAAIHQLHRKGHAGSLFFIEDTSIRIEALSSADEDVPGLRAKEWFADADFSSVRRQLESAGDLRASVKSCVALSVPLLNKPLYFYGETAGRIAAEPRRFEINPLYPWLSPNNFSAWIVPDGTTRTLSEMSFEESLEHDFRVDAFLSLVERLEEFATLMNSSPPVYTRRRSKKESQPALFPIDPPILLVVGPTCSGKTTFGSFVQQDPKWRVIDASSIVRLIREERRVPEMDASDFAHSLLAEEGPDVIARHISRSYVENLTSGGLVVTGFRAIEEVAFFRETYKQVKVVSVETPQRVRYERYVRRGTRKELNTFDDFQIHDERQYSLGLLRVASELADVRISNVYDEKTYFTQIASVLGETRVDAPGTTRVAARLDPERSQLYRGLVVWRAAGRPLTTQEIQRLLGENSIRYNNANKMLKRYPELARRQEGPDINVKYQITPTGLAFISAIDRLHGAVE